MSGHGGISHDGMSHELNLILEYSLITVQLYACMVSPLPPGMRAAGGQSNPATKFSTCSTY